MVYTGRRSGFDSMVAVLKNTWRQAVDLYAGVEKSQSETLPAGWADTSAFVCLIIMVLALPFPDLTGVREVFFLLALIFWIFRL